MDSTADTGGLKLYQPKTGRSCGSCALCCKLLHIPELEKPANTWCKHAKPGRSIGGCTIYERRPLTCRGYHCGWMLSKDISDDWYPRKCHMVITLREFEGIKVCTVNVDYSYSGIWRLEPYYRHLKRMASNGIAREIFLVQIRELRHTYLILPQKDVEVTGSNYVLSFETFPLRQWNVELAQSRAGAMHRAQEIAAKQIHAWAMVYDT